MAEKVNKLKVNGERKPLEKLTYTAVCLALALLLPMITGTIPTIGKALCPMHIPVFLCGFLCGFPYGMILGAVAPLLRCVIFGAPPFYPTAIAMTFELMTYGLISGLMYKILPKKVVFLYISLLVAMLVGRGVSGLSRYILTFVGNSRYSFQIFLADAFVTSLPAIICHIILVPSVVMAMDRKKLGIDRSIGKNISQIIGDRQIQAKTVFYDYLPSTNTLLAEMARQNAESGRVLIAKKQTKGRGRQGKCFLSPRGKGLYLSYLMRPNCQVEELECLTPLIALATRKAIIHTCDLTPQLKWINDIFSTGKKIGGILTEMTIEQGIVPYVIIGIGINLDGKEKDYKGLENIATTIKREGGTPNYYGLAREIITNLDILSGDFHSTVERLKEYTDCCITLGKNIIIDKAGEVSSGKALALDDKYHLLVRYDNGSEEWLGCGDVSLKM